MSGRSGNRNGLDIYWWIRGALVVVVIAAVLGVFGTNSGVKRPELSAVNIIGLATMVVGLGISILTGVLAAKREEDGKGFTAIMRLAGVLVCGVGAMLVFL